MITVSSTNSLKDCCKNILLSVLGRVVWCDSIYFAKSFCVNVLSPNLNTYAKFIAIDSSDNIYVVVDGYVAAGQVQTLMKFNSSGTIQWQKQINGIIRALVGGVDSSDNVYLLENRDVSGSRIIKLNSSGTIQWSKELPDFNLTAMTADLDGNVYIGGTGYDPDASYNDAAFFKYDSSGTLVWANSMSTYNPNNAVINSMCFKDNKIDFTGSLFTSDPGFFFGMIGQINVDGDFLWMNNFYDTNFESGTHPVQGFRVISKSSNAIVFTGSATSLANDALTLFGRIPVDGSLTATYELPSGNLIPYLVGAGSMTSFSPDESSVTISTATGTVTITSIFISVGTTSITSESVEMV